MKKGELIAEFAKRTEMSAAAANGAVNTLIAIITERLKKGDTVGITGFGTFSVAKRAARKGRNPATGEAIKIAASKTPKFSAGATLRPRSTRRRSKRAQCPHGHRKRRYTARRPACGGRRSVFAAPLLEPPL